MAQLFVDLDRSSPIPLYFQVAQQIESAIATGELGPGSRLDNEISLAESFGLSRPTMRRAIQELVDKGLLVRKRGVGTQVVHGKLTRPVELTSLHDDLLRAGQTPSTLLLIHEVIGASELVAERLEVATGSPVLHLRRLRLAAGDPLAILENYLPGNFCDLRAEELQTRGLYQLMRARGVHFRVAKQQIGARTGTPQECRLLGERRGAPLVTMDRATHDDSGAAVEWGHHVYRAGLYSFEVTLVDH